MLQNGNCWSCNALPNAEAASKNQKCTYIFLFFATPSNKNHMYVRFLYICMYVHVCMCVSCSFFCTCLLAAFFAALGFILHGSAAFASVSLFLYLSISLPSYSCVAFFLTFAEFIDIFSICFCALLSLSERALSLFSASRSLSLSFSCTLSHTLVIFFCRE